MKYCGNCGHVNDDQFKFCSECGCKLSCPETKETSECVVAEKRPKPEPASGRRDEEPPVQPKKKMSCWKKGCIVYCIMAVLAIPIFYLVWQIMKGDSEHNRIIKEKNEEVNAPSTRKPYADVEYINEATGDKWGFVLGATGDGSDPIDIAWYMGNGMQGRLMYEMRDVNGNRYNLYEEGQAERSATIYVCPNTDSIIVIRDGQEEYFVTTNAIDHAVSSIDPDYTPARYAIKAGDNGGKWDVLQSGETVYVFPSGEYARSQWVKDGETFYYVDVSGCRMLNNWAHDGFYAGADGSWDKHVKCIDRNMLPQNGKAYKDQTGKTWTFQIKTTGDGTISGKAHLAYPKGIDYEADYNVKSFGSSAYSLHNVKDEFDCWHAVVLDEGSTLRVSGAGVTEMFK